MTRDKTNYKSDDLISRDDKWIPCENAMPAVVTYAREYIHFPAPGTTAVIVLSSETHFSSWKIKSIGIVINFLLSNRRNFNFGSSSSYTVLKWFSARLLDYRSTRIKMIIGKILQNNLDNRRLNTLTVAWLTHTSWSEFHYPTRPE